MTAKKNGAKTEASGLTSCSISSWASVSATIRPATKAPMIAARPMKAARIARPSISMKAGTSGVSAKRGQVNTSRRTPRARRAIAKPSATKTERTHDQAEGGHREVALGSARDDPDEDEREHVVDDGGPDDDAAEAPVKDAQVGQDART